MNVLIPESLVFWLGQAALRTCAVAAVAGLLLTVVARWRNAPTRQLIWRSVVLAGLVMPVLTLMLPPVVVERAPTVAAFVVPQNTHGAGTAVLAGRTGSTVSWESIFERFYVAVAGVLLLRLGLGWLAAARIRRSVVKVDLGETGDVFEAPGCQVPFTMGVLRPLIVLPLDWRTWPEPKRAAVLAHENSHIENRDALFQWLAAIHRTLFWFSPLAWWLERRLAGLSEELSDDAVLAGEHDRIGYAELLAHFLGRTSGGRWAVPMVSMASTGPATKRVERILDEQHSPSTPVGRRLKWAAGAALVCVVLLCAQRAKSQEAKKAPGGEPAKRSEGFMFRSTNYSESDRGYVIVSGNNVSMSGSTYDAEHAEALRGKIAGDYVWFRRGGKNMVIRDGATVKAALSALESQRELSEKQAELGRLQSELGARQAQLGSRQAGVKTRRPDLSAEMDKLNARLKALNEKSEASQAQLGELQAALAEVQAKIAGAQAAAGGEQANLGQEQAALGKQQAELGERQAKLGGEQAKLAEEADRKMRELIERAIKEGKAQPEP